MCVKAVLHQESCFRAVGEVIVQAHGCLDWRLIALDSGVKRERPLLCLHQQGRYVSEPRVRAEERPPSIHTRAPAFLCRPELPDGRENVTAVAFCVLRASRSGTGNGGGGGLEA